jgi:hypothetical protein
VLPARFTLLSARLTLLPAKEAVLPARLKLLPARMTLLPSKEVLLWRGRRKSPDDHALVSSGVVYFHLLFCCEH